MPIYEFRCAACGAVFEKLLRMGSPAPSCPSCGRPSAERMVSLIASQAGCGGSCACSGAT